MHFAYPPRKSSNPPPFVPRSSSSRLPALPALRRSRLKAIALGALAIIVVVFLCTRPSRRSYAPPAPHKPSGNPPAVLVTVLDQTEASPNYIAQVKENREAYAQKHGYEVFFAKVGDYDLRGAPFSWTKVVAMRHALTKYPEATYFWFVEQDVLIMNPDIKVEDHLMKASVIESRMIKDHPVVPPDSIIKTFTHLKGQDVDFMLTQDFDGLAVSSYIIRNSDWAKYFFETWYDPIYRSYNFQKAESHALEHIVQWHPTILSKLALVPQRILNSYSTAAHGEAYTKGDLAVRLLGCTGDGEYSCENAAAKFTPAWREAFKLSS